MAGRLVGKVACISGIGRGQGCAAALRFAAEGGAIYITGQALVVNGGWTIV